jgi:hypothetical protein
VELTQPTYEDPNRGRLEVHVEVSDRAVSRQGSDIEELNAELSKVRSAGEHEPGHS